MLLFCKQSGTGSDPGITEQLSLYRCGQRGGDGAHQQGDPAEDRYDAPGQRLFQERHPGGWADRGACEGTEDRSCIYGAHRKPGAGREIERGDGRGDPKTGIDALRGRPTG